jgi:hypothetical protein
MLPATILIHTQANVTCNHCLQELVSNEAATQLPRFRWSKVPLLLYYRAGVFKSNKINPPDTWEQMLEVAAFLNGTDFNQDGKQDYALCMNLDRDAGQATY